LVKNNNMQWNLLKDITPTEDMKCLVVIHNLRGIEVLNWNEHYQSWDDYEADDHFCEKRKS